MLLLLACATSAAPSAGVSETPQPAAAACPPATYGVLPSDLGAPVPAARLRDQAVLSGTRMLVSGTIREVCQKKGCWHTVGTDDPAVDLLVKDREYAIFLPAGCGGRAVTIAGTFTREVLPLEEARHYAEDAGRDPSLITVAPEKLLFEVEGVQIL